MLYVIQQEQRPGAGAIRAAHQAAHMAYLDAHNAQIVLSGAMLSEETQPLGSCFIVNLPSRQAVDEFVANEPFRKAGLYASLRITRMRRGRWNAEALPKTPEGN